MRSRCVVRPSHFPERVAKLLRIVSIDVFRLALETNEALEELFALDCSFLLRGVALKPARVTI